MTSVLQRPTTERVFVQHTAISSKSFSAGWWLDYSIYIPQNAVCTLALKSSATDSGMFEVHITSTNYSRTSNAYHNAFNNYNVYLSFIAPESGTYRFTSYSNSSSTVTDVTVTLGYPIGYKIAHDYG